MSAPTALPGVYTYVTSAAYEYKPEVGMTLDQFREAFEKAAAGRVEFGFNAIAGYTVGLVLQQTLATTTGLDQESLKKAVFGLSGKLKTLDGTFALDEHGAQIGEITPLGQIEKDGKDVKISVVYPHDLATGKPDLSGK